MADEARWRAMARRHAGADAEPDVIDEIVEHARELYRDRLDAGLSDDEAIASVETELRNVPPLRRGPRQASGRPPLPPPPPSRATPMSLAAAFLRDCLYGLRLLAARPAFTAAAVLTLALGIGANTAIFSVVNSLLLEPLPFPDAGRLVMLWEQDEDDEDLSIVAAPNYQDWARLATSFEHTAIWEYLRFNVSGPAGPEQVLGLRVSSSVFAMLGVPPQLGRGFTAAEDVPGHDVVVIGDALWRRQFGASPAILGQTMLVNGRPFEIVGVMPASFRFTRPDDQVWVPIQFVEQDAQRGSHSFFAAGRLKRGLDFETAKAEMLAIGRQLAREHEPTNRGETATITPMQEYGVGDLARTLWLLLGAVGVVLLIAVVNVANLLLAQASVRQREFAIRSALGAAKGRLASQLLAEGLTLSLAGAAAGVAVAWVATAALHELMPAAVRLAPFRAPGITALDGTVLAFTLGVAVLSGILFSLAPLVAVRSRQPAAALQGVADRGATGRLTWLRGALVAGEVALAVVLLSAGGLLLKSMSRLLDVDPGLDTERVLTMTVALPQEDTYGAPERTTFCADLERELSALPGVIGVGAVSHLPLSGANAGRGFTIEGRAVDPDDGPSAFYRLTCPGYFRALGIPIVKGRDFDHRDTLASIQAVIVNESTAKLYWPDEDPIGKRFKLGWTSSSSPWMTIVGVVGDVRHFGLDEDTFQEIYRPYSQAVWPGMTVTIKTGSEPILLAQAAQDALRRIDPAQPVSNVRSMEDVLDRSLGPRAFPLQLLGLFSLASLALAALGVSGVIGYLVTQRRREIGIRMALGASGRSVTRMVVGRALVPIGIGLVAGLAGAAAATRLLESMLYEVQPADPGVLLGVVAVLAAAALAASYVPARRAAAVDPLIVLRAE